MAVNWPIETVNADILDDGYLPYQGNNVVITENAHGPVQMRCAYTAVSWFHPIKLKFTLPEYLLFKAFVDTTLRYGTLSFYFPLPSKTDLTQSENALCRFYIAKDNSPYRIAKILADNWVFVSFTLEEFAA